MLKTVPDGMKAKFRELEKLYLKIVKERSHRTFNEVCLKVYIYIYIYDIIIFPYNNKHDYYIALNN